MDIMCMECGKKLARRRKTGLCKKCLLDRQVGQGNPNWKGETVSSAGMHMRIKAERGSASKYRCVDCGEAAKEWSKRHDSNPFSIDSYSPRCYGCHRAYDKDIIHSKESRDKNSKAHKRPWTRARHMMPRREGFKPPR